MKSSQFWTIPGVIDVSVSRNGLVLRLAGDICNGDGITWQDPGDHFGMCETCYSHLCESEVRT